MDLFRLLVLIPAAVLLGSAGLALLLVPPKTLLVWDRRTGSWLAQLAKSPGRGERLAGAFCKTLGIALLAVVMLGLLPGILR